MNDAQFAAYSIYVRQLADALLLADWEVTLKRDFCEDGAYAAVFVMHGENHVFLRFCEQFFSHSREEHREWCCHELLHAQFDRLRRVMARLRDQVSEDGAVEYAAPLHASEIEVCVQRLARIVAPLLPLPPQLDASSLLGATNGLLPSMRSEGPYAAQDARERRTWPLPPLVGLGAP